jgi:hypothetical protein
VSVVSWLLAGEPKAVPAAVATAQTTANENTSRQRFRAFQWNFKVIPP